MGVRQAPIRRRPRESIRWPDGRTDNFTASAPKRSNALKTEQNGKTLRSPEVNKREQAQVDNRTDAAYEICAKEGRGAAPRFEAIELLMSFRRLLRLVWIWNATAGGTIIAYEMMRRSPKWAAVSLPPVLSTLSPPNLSFLHTSSLPWVGNLAKLPRHSFNLNFQYLHVFTYIYLDWRHR